MTLGELINLYRARLEDESIGVRRSWEETFRYATKHFPPETSVADFNIEVLAERLSASGMQQQFVDGYVTRWRNIIEWTRSL